MEAHVGVGRVTAGSPRWLRRGRSRDTADMGFGDLAIRDGGGGLEDGPAATTFTGDELDGDIGSIHVENGQRVMSRFRKALHEIRIGPTEVLSAKLPCLPVVVRVDRSKVAAYDGLRVRACGRRRLGGWRLLSCAGCRLGRRLRTRG